MTHDWTPIKASDEHNWSTVSFKVTGDGCVGIADTLFGDDTNINTEKMLFMEVGQLMQIAAAVALTLARPPLCTECETHPADVPGKLCPECEAYRDHTGGC